MLYLLHIFLNQFPFKMQIFKAKFIYLFLAFLCITFFSIPVFSQNPIQLQDIKNASGIINQISPSGVSQSQLSNMLNDKNINKNQYQAGADKNAVDQKMTTEKKDSSLIMPVAKPIYSPENTYGANIFASTAVTDLAELSTPPLDYPIGVGDHIIVALWGAAELQENYVVGRDGSIFPQGLGKINVAGLTFEEIRSIISSRFKKVVPSATNISVSLGQPRTISINVVGEVLNPGPVAVSAFSNAFNVIALAGGVTEYGNLRSIQIKRGGEVIDELDVYKYLKTGDFGKHIYLQNNDFVIVGFVEKKVFATGQFKRPMYYQLKADEGVKALLKYSGGLNSESVSSTLKVIRTENEKKVQRDVNSNFLMKDSASDFLLNDGDIIKVDLLSQNLMNRIEVRGEVNYPGEYELKEGEGLYDLINRAGGITRFTLLDRAFIFRGFGDSARINSKKLEVDISGYLTDNDLGVNNIKLQSNDIIQLLSKKDFEEDLYVDIFGEVRKQGRVKQYKGMTLQDLLYLSGGIKSSAQFGRLEISSIMNMDSAKKGLLPVLTTVKSYAIQPNLQIDSTAKNILINPYDQVFVRKNPSFELQENVDIKGMVKYPGKYPRLDKNEKLSSFIQRAGGLQPNANLGGAVLFRTKTQYFRESVVDKPKIDSLKGTPVYDSLADAYEILNEPVSIDLYNALNKKKSKYDIVLQQNDMIFVPEINPFVSVRGQVQSPLKIAFDKDHSRLGYYLDKSGGFGERPWKKRVYVTYANGRSRKTKSILFFRHFPKVTEGSIVTVPIKPPSQSFGEVAKTILISTIPVLLTAVVLKFI